jgi:hypothetical protein
LKQLSYRSAKTEVRNSSIQGKGLFANTHIPAGEIVAIKGGYILSLQEWRQFAEQLGPAEIQISDTHFIAPLRKDERDGSMLYTNHSCDPNIGIQGQIIFVAMRDIKPGEELTHDWATTDDSDDQMECHCGSPICRGIVTGKDWKRKDLQQKYRGWFSWYLQQKINANS